MRFDKIVPAGKKGNGIVMNGKAGQGDSRDSSLWAICCDQWDSKRRTIISDMERTDGESGRLNVGPKL